MPRFLRDSTLDILAKDIQVLFAPLYKGLKIEIFLEEGFKDPNVKHYLPDQRDLHRLPRQYIVNVIFTVVGQPIKDYVNKCIKQRNDELAENRDLLIELDPQIAAAFKTSLNISSKLFTVEILLREFIC